MAFSSTTPTIFLVGMGGVTVSAGRWTRVWRGSRVICSLCWSCSLVCSWVCLCSVTLSWGVIGVLLALLLNTAYERKASEGRERQVVARVEG